MHLGIFPCNKFMILKCGNMKSHEKQDKLHESQENNTYCVLIKVYLPVDILIQKLFVLLKRYSMFWSKDMVYSAALITECLFMLF